MQGKVKSSILEKERGGAVDVVHCVDLILELNLPLYFTIMEVYEPGSPSAFSGYWLRGGRVLGVRMSKSESTRMSMVGVGRE